MSKGQKTGKQPYIPLYIGDWEQDTNMLSLEAEGGWLKIVFKMWKQKNSNLQNATKPLQGIYKISTKALQNLWRKNPQQITEIVEELKNANVCELEYLDDFYTFGNRRMIKESSISIIRSKAVQNRYQTKHKTEHPSEYEYICILLNTVNTGILQEEKVDIKKTAMLIIEMMKIWDEALPNYVHEQTTDYHACLNIAYKIAEMEKWKKAEVIAEYENDCLMKWAEYVKFISGHKWFSGLTLDSISTPKNWQKLLNEIKNPAANGLKIVQVNGLEEARADYLKKMKQ